MPDTGFGFSPTWCQCASTAAAVICFSALSVAPFAQQGTTEAAFEQIYRVWADQQRALIQQRLRKWDTAILQARLALNRASGLRNATSRAAREVAQQAFTVADTALERAIAGRARDADRLRALDKMLDPMVLRLAAASQRGDDVVLTSRMSGEGLFIQSRTTPRRRQLGEGAIKLQPGDEIDTGANSVDVMLADGSWVNLPPNAKLKYDPKTGFELIKGKFHRIVECMRQRLRNRAPTPCGAIKVGPVIATVRGTEYSAETVEHEDSSIKVFEGVVDLRHADGTSVAVQTGHQVRVLRDGTLRGPTPFDVAAEPRWWED